MPIPSREKVVELLSGHAHGYDIEDVTVSRAGSHSVVKVIVDRDEGFELDAIADLSRDISVLLDELDDGGNAAYNLEVTTPGVERPLTEPRHWRRSRGRRASVRLVGTDSADTEQLDARVGALVDGDSAVELVLNDKTGPYVRTVSLADIEAAVVEVEFRKPNPRELELTGGVTPGRFDPTNPPAEPEGDFDDESDDSDDDTTSGKGSTK